MLGNIISVQLRAKGEGVDDMDMLEAIRKLSPTSFENLVFDLLRSSGIKNLVWRTPGADGGRDIEGTFASADFSGTVRETKWFIECKRYGRSVGWPVVWEKIAYSDAGSIDFLLIVTTATFSPRCHDEVEKWNAQHRRPQVRLWPGNELAARIELNVSLMRKYRLVEIAPLPATVLTDLAMHTAKMAQAASASLVFGKPSTRHMEAASALAELMMIRSADLERGGVYVHPANGERFVWPTFTVAEGQLDVSKFDEKSVGPTISNAERARIFELGFRGQSAKNRVASGTGLGLTICKTIIEGVHGGEMWVESSADGETSFFMRFPTYSKDD